MYQLYTVYQLLCKNSCTNDIVEVLWGICRRWAPVDEVHVSEVDAGDVGEVDADDVGDVMDIVRDVEDVGDVCDVDEVDVDDVGDVKDVGDVMKMKCKVEFGSSSLGKTLRMSF